MTISGLNRRAPDQAAYIVGPVKQGGNGTADLADKEAALAAHPDSFFTIPHFDGYRAALVRLTQVTGAALREAITAGWLACAPPRLARDFPAF
jgi:hypothetical protein